MKKILAMLLAITMTIGITACGSDTNNKEEKKSSISGDSESDVNLSITVAQGDISKIEEEQRLFHEGVTFTSVTQDERFTYVHYVFNNKLSYPVEFPIEMVQINNKYGLSINGNGEPYLDSVESSNGFYAETGETTEGAFVFANVKAGDDVRVWGSFKKPDGSVLKAGFHFTFEEGDGSVSVVLDENSSETETTTESETSTNSENEDTQVSEILTNELGDDIEYTRTFWGDLGVLYEIPRVLYSDEDAALTKKGNSLVKSTLGESAKMISPFNAYHTWYYTRDDATPNVWFSAFGVGSDGYTKVNSNAETYDTAVPFIELMAKYAYCDDFHLDYETFTGKVTLDIGNEEERLYPKGDDTTFVNKPPYASYATDETDFYWLSKSGTITVEGSEGEMTYKCHGCFIQAFEVNGGGLGNLQKDTPMFLFALSKDADEGTLDKIITHAYESMDNT